VIPEIEMPGHARAAVQAMEARYQRMKAAGKKDAAQYLLNDSTTARLPLAAVVHRQRHQSRPRFELRIHRARGGADRGAAPRGRRAAATIHMGGDELANGAWEKSPASLARMRKEKLDIHGRPVGLLL
jgi:hexosaminidase